MMRTKAITAKIIPPTVVTISFQVILIYTPVSEEANGVFNPVGSLEKGGLTNTLFQRRK